MPSKDQEEEYVKLVKQKDEKLREVQQLSRDIKDAQKQIGKGWEDEEDALMQVKKELDKIHIKMLELEKKMG